MRFSAYTLHFFRRTGLVLVMVRGEGGNQSLLLGDQALHGITTRPKNTSDFQTPRRKPQMAPNR